MLFDMPFPHPLIKYSCYVTHKSYKMVDNKSKTPLIRHIQEKYFTNGDKQYNTCAMYLYNIVIFTRDIFFSVCHSGSFPIVVIATFHTDIVTHTSSTFLFGLTTNRLNIPKISKKDVW